VYIILHIATFIRCTWTNKVHGISPPPIVVATTFLVYPGGGKYQAKELHFSFQELQFMN